MKKASISETKNRLSALLKEVAQGETILIVDRDGPIARLEAVRPGSGDAADWIGELERRGVVRRGCGGPVRKLLSQLNAVEAMEFLIDKMQGTKTNEEFLDSMNA